MDRSLSLYCSSVSPVLMSMTGVRWAAESLRSAQLTSSGIQWRFHREQSSAPSHRPLVRRGWHSVTEPLSPIPRPIFSAPAEGAFCLFIYLLEMNKRYQEPSVRICKCPSHLQTCEMHNESGDNNNNARQYHWKQALLMQPQCTEKYHPVTLLVPNEFVCMLIKSSTSTCSILLFMDHV